MPKPFVVGKIQNVIKSYINKASTMDNLGVRLADLRRRAGHTQESLAAATRVSRSHIAKIESDPTANPTIGLIETLVKGCGANLAEFFRSYAPQYPEFEETCRKLFAVMESGGRYRTGVEVNISAVYEVIRAAEQSEGKDSPSKKGSYILDSTTLLT